MTKALPGYIFKKFRDQILGRVLHNEKQIESIKSTQAIQDIDNISYSYIEGLCSALPQRNSGHDSEPPIKV